MRCPAEILTERIEKNKTFSRHDTLNAEVFSRRCSTACAGLFNALNKHIIKAKREKDIIEQPTIHEQTKEALKRPKKKWFRWL